MDAFGVSLVSQPLTNVLVTLSSSSEDFAWSPTSLTFTPENWDQPQEISVLGNPDLVIEGIETTIPFLLKVVTDRDFINGDFNTSYLKKFEAAE